MEKRKLIEYIEIDAQKSQCEEVISSKDKLIKEYRQEIKNKEDEYVYTFLLFFKYIFF